MKMVRSIESRFISLWQSRRKSDQIASLNPTSLTNYFPAVRALLDDPEFIGPVPDNVWKALDVGFEDAAHAFAKAIEGECAAMFDQKSAGSNTDSRATGTFSKDAINPVLSVATSLFKYKPFQGSLISYAGILKLRMEYGPRSSEFQMEGPEVPEGVVDIANMLLRHMSLPETSSMLFLEKIGKQFRCDRCLRYDSCHDAMTWSRLVSSIL